jgi:predicted TIM-barrel fold metal-dependent hydrolase
MVPVQDRRAFLAGALASPLLANAFMRTAAAEEKPQRPTLDLHVHLFGLDEATTGCRMSEKITRGFAFLALSYMLNLRVKGKTLDQRYEEVLVEQLKGSGLTKAAILGQDAVYDRDGKIDWERTSFYVPNDYVFTVVAKHAELMIPCPSINPNRADAIDELVRCHEKGARMLKIHPPTQGVDVADKKHTKFFRRCQELKMLVLVHTGHEHSAPVIDKALAAPHRLALALEQGCSVVACHAGTGWISDEPDQLPEFLALLKRYPKLWGDTAVLGTSGRVRDVGRLLEDKELVSSRLLHGSDFPFPANPEAFGAKIGEAAAKKIGAETNWLKKDFELKEALGIGRASAERAYDLVLGEAKVGGP